MSLFLFTKRLCYGITFEIIVQRRPTSKKREKNSRKVVPDLLARNLNKVSKVNRLNIQNFKASPNLLTRVASSDSFLYFVRRRRNSKKREKNRRKVVPDLSARYLDKVSVGTWLN